MKSDLQLDKQQFENVLAGIWLGSAEVIALVEQLGSSAASKDGFTHLLLSALANRSGAIETAESHIYKAFTADPDLLKKLLPPENPNHGATLATDYPMTQVDTCPVCRSGERRSVYAGLVVAHVCYHEALAPMLHWVECNGCSHVYAREQNTSDALFGGPPRATTHSTDISMERYNNDCESVAHLTEMRRGGRVLEIGPGNGTRLAAFRDMGMDTVGLEIQEEITAHCQRLGLNVRLEDFLKHSPDAPYDVIALGDVIEHLPDLHGSLEKIRDMAAPDGLVWMSTPQYDNFILQEARTRGADPYLVELEHWHYFTRASLIRLMEDYGFQLIRQRMGKTFIASVEYTFQRS